MQQNEQVYNKLQKHLDNQAIGFPATRSGVEIKILKHIFTPDEAEIACCLSYKFEPLKTIFSKAGHRVDSPEELEKCLDCIQKKGGIESKIKNGKMHYCNAPLVVGMYEFQLERLTPEFIKDFNEYTSHRNFGLAFLNTKLPQMRTIPVAKSIHPQHNVSTYDEVATLMQAAEDPFVSSSAFAARKNRWRVIPARRRTAKKPVLPSVTWAGWPGKTARAEKLAETKRCRSSQRIRNRDWCFSRPIRKKPNLSVHAAGAAAGC